MIQHKEISDLIVNLDENLSCTEELNNYYERKLQKLNQCKRTLDLVSRETFVVDVLCGKYH